jgi:hypothetical protein
VLTYRPATGVHLRYQIDVRSSSTVRLDGSRPRHTADTTRLTVDQLVVQSGPRGSTVDIDLQSPGRPSQHFVALVDGNGQLAEIKAVEGLPAAILGRLGISELFPTVGALPKRRLAPGDQWTLDQTLTLPDGGSAALRGKGHLTAFSVDGRYAVARVEETYRLPVRQSTSEPEGRLSLAGTETTTASTTRSIRDGTVVRSGARTVGRFAVVLMPPADAPDAVAGVRVAGTMVVEVVSTTRRLP